MGNAERNAAARCALKAWGCSPQRALVAALGSSARFGSWLRASSAVAPLRPRVGLRASLIAMRRAVVVGAPPLCGWFSFAVSVVWCGCVSSVAGASPFYKPATRACRSLRFAPRRRSSRSARAEPVARRHFSALKQMFSP